MQAGMHFRIGVQLRSWMATPSFITVNVTLKGLSNQLIGLTRRINNSDKLSNLNTNFSHLRTLYMEFDIKRDKA